MHNDTLSKGLAERLSIIIGKAFEKECEFLTKFWRGSRDDELMECYMASECTRITVLTGGGVMVTDTISTKDFIDWAENQRNKSSCTINGGTNGAGKTTWDV